MYASIESEENENEDNKRRRRKKNRMRRNETENITIIEFAIVCHENKFANVFFSSFEY